MTRSISDLEKTSLLWDRGKTSNRDFDQVVVDLLELHQELIKSEDLLRSVIDSLAELERLQQEQV